jgi:hypothetical protein
MSLLWLKNVPWATILANAPGLVDGAKKLAAAMRNTAGSTVAEPVREGDLNQRLLALESQQQAAADLLRKLAEQNEEMVAALAALRARAKLHFRIALAALFAAGAVLVWSIFR